MIAVLDASVVLKWFHREPDSAMAGRLRDAVRDRSLLVRVPDLLRYEVANVLVWKKECTTDSAIEAIETLEQLPWYIAHPSHEILSTAVRIADRYRTSVYDAVYVALALEDDAPLITADEKLIAKLNHPKVIHLRDFKLS